MLAVGIGWRASVWLGFGGLDFAIPGALFGVTVLCPYLRAGHRLMTRALALIGASALSYSCAVMTALNADAWFAGTPFFVAFLLGSFIGVSMAARFLIPLRVTAAFWSLGLVASLTGGAAMYAGFEVFGDTTESTVVGFCVGHVAACLAIYRGRQSSDDAERGLLADFARTRGRFSIVPGWIRLSHAAAR